MDIKARILELKKERNAVILAHYYVPDEVQEIADYIGDSFYLSKIATGIEADTIVFCGVSFMGESAKILNPNKIVIMPDETADCAMAHMAAVDKIQKVREQYDDVAVVCYINSVAELKVHSDVCVTSANAVKIVEALPNKNIYFIPDVNLARYVAGKVKDKNFIFNDGFCPIHHALTKEEVEKAKQQYPNVKVLTHPECTEDVLALSDFIGSTSEIIDFATECEDKEFIIATETGVFYELEMKNPDKKFYPVISQQICPNMKKVTLEKVKEALLHLEENVKLEEELKEAAFKPLNRMLELAQA